MKRAIIFFLLFQALAFQVFAQYLVEAMELEAFDNAFVNYIWIMDELALKYNLEIKVQGVGFREAGVPISNAYVPPSETSNHLVGHAVDINTQLYLYIHLSYGLAD
jgi:hypothetical protein